MITAPVRKAGTLAAIAAVLVAAFVVAPPVLAGSRPAGGFDDQRDLTEALRAAFAEYWRSGDRELSPGLAQIVDYWFRYHLVKAVVAAVLLVVLGALGVLLWKAFVRTGGLGPGKRVLLASAGVVVTMLAVFSLAIVMANVQGAVAPFSSLLPLLSEGGSAGPLEPVRLQMAAGRTPPALDAMISDFARYHEAMAVIAAIVAVVLAGMSVLVWRRFAGTRASDRRTRRVLASFGVLSVVLPVAVAVVAVANTTTAADPAPALLAFFEGGW